MSHIQTLKKERAKCTPGENEVCLCTEDLCLSYGTKVVLKGVSLHIPFRSVTAIIGPSGSGKSSFLNCLNRLTDLTENSSIRGSVKFACNDIRCGNGPDPVMLRRQIGTVFQRPTPFPFSIWKNLALPLEHHRLCRKADLKERIEIALRQVGLWDEVHDRLHGPATALSGGQQQRLCIARALVLQPSVLLMDEPCSALDPISTARIEELIVELKKDYTIVIVTHNLAQARRIADYVALFWSVNGHGQLIERGPAAQVFERPNHELTGAYLQGRV